MLLSLSLEIAATDISQDDNVRGAIGRRCSSRGGAVGGGITKANCSEMGISLRESWMVAHVPGILGDIDGELLYLWPPAKRAAVFSHHQPRHRLSLRVIPQCTLLSWRWVVSTGLLKITFINSILTYKDIVLKLEFPNFGNHCLETERGQTHQTPQTTVQAETPLELQFE